MKMPESGNSGHRQRIKKQYIAQGVWKTDDYVLLELLLSYAIPRKDVKPIAKSLISTFGSLENVFKADIQDLSNVKEVGTHTAILIHLVKDLNRKIGYQKSEKIKSLRTTEETKQYFDNYLKNQDIEKIALVTLDNNLNIIKLHRVSEGSVNYCDINLRNFFERIIRDNASSVIIAHNHPNGNSKPSADDIDLTLRIIEVARKMDITLLDHIIVGTEDTYSLKEDPRFIMMFDEMNKIDDNKSSNVASR